MTWEPSPPGSVAEEAARLLDAMQRWVGERHLGEHVATGGLECRLCPLCRLIAVAKGARPEVVAHLAAASSELLAALRAAIAAAESAPRRRPDGLEHIEIR